MGFLDSNKRKVSEKRTMLAVMDFKHSRGGKIHSL